MSAERTPVVVAAVRTPIARAHPERGAFRDVRADDLSADIMRALLERADVADHLVEDIHWGCVRQAGEQGYDVARQAALIAGMPIEVPATTVNRNCGSSLQALNQAAANILAGLDDIQIAGGVEHMHHLPMDDDYSASPRYLYRHSAATLNMGLIAENQARKYDVARADQDAWALRSHQRAAAADWSAEIVPTWGRDDEGRKVRVNRDQGPRPDTSIEALAKLPAVFRSGGSVTAGNASPLNVGAAALLVMSEAKATALGLTPLVRVKSMAVAGVDPSVMGIGPVPATHKALQRADLSLADIDIVEINEAFAVQTLACIRLLGLDPEKVNVNGGAIAIGHPLGASGARIATTLIHTMFARKVRYGLATMCIGGGQGIATLFERA
jgi:acetyl-CoA acyltransferase